MDSNNRVEYHIYTKIRGEWFDKRFKAKEHHQTDNFALTKAQACKIAGKNGRVWRIETRLEQIHGGTS